MNPLLQQWRTLFLIPVQNLYYRATSTLSTTLIVGK
nr:MAG TPA: hypothetical protein [Caudoviricetes sp.]